MPPLLPGALPRPGEAGLPEEPAQLRLLRRGERLQLAHDVPHVARKDPADQSAALVGERDRDEPPVLRPPVAAHEPAPREVADHHRDVPAAAEELAAQVPLAERSPVEQRLQRAELADGQVVGAHQRIEARGHRVGRAHELDVRVERGPLLRGTPVVGGHTLNLNRLLVRAPPRCQGRRGHDYDRGSSTTKRHASRWLTMRPAVGWWKWVPSTATGRSAERPQNARRVSRACAGSVSKALCHAGSATWTGWCMRSPVITASAPSPCRRTLTWPGVCPGVGSRRIPSATRWSIATRSARPAASPGGPRW